LNLQEESLGTRTSGTTDVVGRMHEINLPPSLTAMFAVAASALDIKG